ncbi:UNVERIFIED_CONTAM: F-BAR domain only protein 2 [Gekko kuhli]
MTKLAKSASNYSQLGSFAPVWDVFKSSSEKLASCHLELVRKLQELIKEVQKYGDEQIKAHKKTKEEVSGTLEAVQSIQSITQALQKAKENYNSKCVEQERLKKEGATQREIDKAAVKSKKATDTYKLYVEKYAAAKSDFEQKMTETAQKFQDIEEMHLSHMKEIIESFSNTVKEVHLQIGEVHEEFINNMANTSVESLVQKFAESKGTGKERPAHLKVALLTSALALSMESESRPTPSTPTAPPAPTRPPGSASTPTPVRSPTKRASTAAHTSEADLLKKKEKEKEKALKELKASKKGSVKPTKPLKAPEPVPGAGTECRSLPKRRTPPPLPEPPIELLDSPPRDVLGSPIDLEGLQRQRDSERVSSDAHQAPRSSPSRSSSPVDTECRS